MLLATAHRAAPGSQPCRSGWSSSSPDLSLGQVRNTLDCFTILGFLANATRWPKRLCWPLIVFLVVYGITTESLQLFVPHRTARVMDGIENILGIAAGSGIYWLLLRLMQPFLKVNLAANLVKHAVEVDAADVR